MIIAIDVKRVDVIEREHGTDKVIVHTHNLAPTVHPYDELGSFVMDIRKGYGAQYVRENFKIEPNVINVI